MATGETLQKPQMAIIQFLKERRWAVIRFFKSVNVIKHNRMSRYISQRMRAASQNAEASVHLSP